MRLLRIAAGALLAAPMFAQMTRSPLLVFLGGDPKPWQTWCGQHGWLFNAPWNETAGKSVDVRLKDLAAKVEALKKTDPVDPGRVYLAAQGDGASLLFYAVSRIPDQWTAAVAAGGSPRSAIDTNRLFAANTTNVPVLWLFASKDEEALAKRLTSAGFNVEAREEPSAKFSEVFDWLARHQRDSQPTTADCETGSPLFSRCYWVEMTKFDPAERNDVLDSTRVPPIGTGASLAIGPFGYKPDEPGPGVLVTWLPDKYEGPLKLNDRIVALGGKELKNAAEYAAVMYQASEEKPVVAMAERGKEHIRLETKISVPAREESLTARVRARYLPETQEIEVISRTITQMRLNVPQAWLPARISWNGTDVAKAESPGCWLLDEQKELLTAKRCP